MFDGNNKERQPYANVANAQEMPSLGETNEISVMWKHHSYSIIPL